MRSLRLNPFRREQLDEMSVRVAQENLPRAVRPLLLRPKLRAGLLQMLFPGREVVGPEREMVVAVGGDNRRAAPADQVQFLVRAQPEPCARKIKRRARHRLQPQNLAIKSAAPFHVRDVDGHMIELVNLHHAEGDKTSRPPKGSNSPGWSAGLMPRTRADFAFAIQMELASFPTV